MDWCTIESDPGVFTELIERFGVRDVEVTEVFSMDDASFAQLGEVHGLIFLFKWQEDKEPRECVSAQDVPSLFFARQVIQNACATQALLSVLLNAPTVETGAMLSEFKAFTGAFSAADKGVAISNQDAIREAHNSFARAEPFVIEAAPNDDEGEAYHFVAYVTHAGAVYELDGLREGPILLGDAGGNWLDAARPAIQARMTQYAQSEIRFTLLALIRSPLSVARADLAAAQAAGEAARQAELEAAVAELEARRAQWTAENNRRRHNYLPFILALTRSMAARGALRPLVVKAVAAAAEAASRGGGGGGGGEGSGEEANVQEDDEQVAKRAKS